MSHAEYCRSREEQERLAAEAATSRPAMVAHRRMAAMFAERARAAERHARIKAVGDGQLPAAVSASD